MPTVYFNPKCKSEGWVENILEQTPGERGVWNDLEAVSDIDEADYQVAFYTVPENPNGVKTLLLTREPPCLFPESRWDQFDVYATFPISRHYSPVMLGHMDKTYDDLKSQHPPEKSLDLSWVISNKGQESNPFWFRFLKWYRRMLMNAGYRKYQYKHLPFTEPLVRRGGRLGQIAHKLNNGLLNWPTDGHVVRMDFLKSLINRYPGIVDVYGYGTWDESLPYYEGELEDKWIGIAPYRYSLALHNYYGPSYMTKITDPLMAWCMPITWGCTNLSEFIPEDAFVTIDIEDENAPHQVKEIIESDIREQNLDAIAKARELILDRYQIWPTVERLIDRSDDSVSPKGGDAGR